MKYSSGEKVNSERKHLFEIDGWYEGWRIIVCIRTTFIYDWNSIVRLKVRDKNISKVRDKLKYRMILSEKT